MGFWIEYGFAVKDEPRSVRNQQKPMNRIIKKCDKSRNDLRTAIGIRQDGKADWMTEAVIRKGILYLWTYIRCGWMDYNEFAAALRKRFVGDGPEMYFMINENDLDPGRADENGVVTNDKDGKYFAYQDIPLHFTDETI